MGQPCPLQCDRAAGPSPWGPAGGAEGRGQQARWVLAWLGACGSRPGLSLTLGVDGSSGSGALAPLVPLLRPQCPGWAGGSGLGMWAASGLSEPGRPGGLGVSRARRHSERSRGLSGAWSRVAVSSFTLGLRGPVGCGCCLPGRAAPAALPSGPSESEPTGGEGGVPRSLDGPLSLAPPACPRARSCWARSTCNAPSSRGSRMSTRAPGRPSRPMGSSQASATPAFRTSGRLPPGAVADTRGLLWGLRRCRDRWQLAGQRRSAWREGFRDSQVTADGREARRKLWEVRGQWRNP